MSTVTWRRILIALAVVAVVIAGVVVAVRVFMHPRATPPAALPQSFPDLTGFTDVSQDHDVSRHYPLATFTSPTGLQCAMWSSRGDTAAACFGTIPGLDHPANQVYAGDYKAHFDQSGPPAGQKLILGAGGTLMGGDQITCGVHDVVVACELIRGFHQNHGDDTAQRHGFVLDPQRSWTF
jgi:hypothetical protein